MYLAVIIGTLVIIFIFYKIQKRIELLRKLKDFKGPKGWPILGNCLELNVPKEEVLNLFERWKKEYGGCMKFFIGLEPYFLVTDPDQMEKILSSYEIIEKSEPYKFFHRWLGLGLLTSGGERWAHRRKLLTPAFHVKILEDFMKVFNKQCNTLKSTFVKKENETFDMFPLITLCALDIICESVMGRKINAQETSDSDHVKATLRMNEILYYRHLRPWLHPELLWRLSSMGREEKRCLEILHGFSDKVIKERKTERQRMGSIESVENLNDKDVDTFMESSKRKRLAFLDLLLDAQETDSKLTDMNIREETDTFLLAGHDTTATAVNWTTFLIASDSSIQKKVQEELDNIFGADREREVNMEDLTKMKYLECCIKEGLRIFPSVPVIGRSVTEDLELSGGLVAPKGTTFYIYLYGLHRNENIFPDSEKFDPDRFLSENAQGRHPFSYVPFSSGPRNCIGQKFAMMEEKVMLSTIFRNFSVEAMEKREDIPVLCEVVIKPANGLKIRVRQR